MDQVERNHPKGWADIGRLANVGNDVPATIGPALVVTKKRQEKALSTLQSTS